MSGAIISPLKSTHPKTLNIAPSLRMLKGVGKMEGEGSKGLGVEKVDGDNNLWILKGTRPKYESFLSEYVAKDGDVVVASVPKTGSTWTRALVHSVVASGHSMPNMLTHKHPRDLLPCAEITDAAKWRDMPSPRHIGTHLPYHALPSRLRDGPVKIVYVARNPRDTFVSTWKFREQLARTTTIGFAKDVTKEEFLESFCSAMRHGGPFVEHVLGYYEESKRNPHKVLFLTYEALQADCEGCVCKMAEFLGYPAEVVRPRAADIAKLCSFDSLANVPSNKSETSVDGFMPPYAAYFREGRVGGWKQYFTPDMEDRIRVQIEDKLEQNGLRFSYE